MTMSDDNGLKVIVRCYGCYAEQKAIRPGVFGFDHIESCRFKMSKSVPIKLIDKGDDSE